MLPINTISKSLVVERSADNSSGNQLTYVPDHNLNETRNSTGGMEIERDVEIIRYQPLEQLNEKLLETRNLSPDAKSENLACTLDNAHPVNVKNDREGTLNTSQAQVGGIDQLDSPSCVLHRKGAVSIDDAQRIAQSVMTVLERAYPKYPEKLEMNQRLLAHINKMEAESPYSHNDLYVLYSFFKRAEDVTRQLSKPSKENIDNMDLSRIMKWNFRSGLNAMIKESLDLKLDERLAYLAQGGSRSNEVGVTYAQSLDPAGVIGVNIQVNNKRTLESTHAGEVKSSSGFEIDTGVSLISGLAEFGLSFGTTETKKYATLADYVSTNSAKLSTWFAESKFTALSNLSDIIKLASSYESDILYTNVSRPFLRDKLSAKNMSDVRFDSAQLKIWPVEVHYTQRKSVTGQVALSCFIAISGKLSVSLEIGTKNKRMDLVDVMEVDSEAALALVKDKGNVKEGGALVQSLSDHLKLHSSAITTAILRGCSHSEIRERLTICKQSAGQILADYVVSKASNKVDASSERVIQDMLSEHSVLLRPESLRVYNISTPIKRNVCTASVNLTDPLALLNAKAEAQLISVLQNDDPHFLGEFFELELSGEIKTMDGLNLLVSTLLNNMGSPSPSLAALPSSLGGAALHQSHGISSLTLIKIKDGVPLMLVQQVFNNANDDVKLNIPAAPGSFVKLRSDVTFKMLLSETLGVETLDFILPVARRKIKDMERCDSWDAYVAAHVNDFKKLIQNISDSDAFPLLNKEIENISRSSAIARKICKELYDSAARAKVDPTDANFEVAFSLLKRYLANYISTDYGKKVREKWTLLKAEFN